MNRLRSSFRDPNGFVYHRDGRLLRQVNLAYRDHYDALLESGLYGELVNAELLIPHDEVSADLAETGQVYRVLEPQRLPFVSYPYEWCFSQLKDAARTTLQIQKKALARGMTLKDASAYNIQFYRGKPILIDTLSFERFQEGTPWIAYRQFCQHFLAPLAIMSCHDIRLGRLLERFLDGIPLDLASEILPQWSWLRPSLAVHVHLHARSIRRYADASRDRVKRSRRVSRRGLEGLLAHLEGAVDHLQWKREKTEWADYEMRHGYSEVARADKERVVDEYLKAVAPASVWDLGSNTGFFSQLAARAGSQVVALDGDPGAIEFLYQRVKGGEQRILPLWVDLSNPSPAVGWAHRERDSLAERGPAGLILALALIHHLAISNNVPLEEIAQFLSGLGRNLIIEFVPKSDPQAQRLLVSREDIFADYTQASFEHAFSQYFTVISSSPIGEGDRRIYRMARIGS